MSVVSKWKVALVTTAVWLSGVQTDGLNTSYAEDDLASADFSAELPRIPATDPDEALETFEVAKGFEIQLVASEPLIGTPVAIEWDAAGGLFVCEMRGYSEDRDEGISQISRLTDSDDDGVYDQSTVYADGLFWPTGLFPYDGGLFVGDAPNLYYFKDTDADGKADVKKLVLTGFGTSNVQGLMNSFRWGLDNRIHIACSSVGGQIRHPDQPESEAVNVRGRDIAFDPRTGEFEPTSGAAQHGMCFDDWGRKFVSSNSDHLQQVMYEDDYIARNPYMQAPPARITIAADGPQAEVFRISPVEPWRIVRTRLRVSGTVRGPIEGGGRAAGYFTGATGVTIYRGDAWPEDWRGLAIIGDVGSNLVHRKRLEADGLKMVGKRIDSDSEFVASEDIWFRPAQFANAPDGSLHIVDVCREVIEHPKSLPPAIKKHLDLTSGRNRGRIYRVVDKDFQYRPAPRLQTVTTEELVGLLEHRNAWHRETAARLLYQRQDPAAITSLQQLVSKPSSPLARMHALYVLSGLGELDPDSVMKGLDDPHPHVRRHAIRLAETIRSVPGLQNKLAGLASDPSLLVRYQLAFTAGSIRDWNPVETLATIIQQDVNHRYMQAAVQSSLVQHAGALFQRLVADPNFRSPEAGEFLSRLATQINRQQDPAAVKQALQVVPQLPVDDAAFALPVLGELLKSRTKAGSLVARMDSEGELAEVDQAVDRMISVFMEQAQKTDLPAGRRVEAIRALRFASVDRVADLLQSLIDSTETIEVQRAAINTLGSFTTDHVSDTLIEQWNTFSPSLRETASEVMFARRGRLSALLDAIDEGDIPLSEISRTRLQATAKTGHPSIRGRVQALLAKGGSQERSKIVAEYRKALRIEGDVDNGRKLFVKHCATCHRVENQGHEIGPNLATIKTRGPETILVNVLDPNAEVNPQYLSYIVLTVDGRTISGMISSESANGITLKRADAESDQVLRSDIERLQSSGLSIMPEGFEKELSPPQVADLIAYLMQVP